MAETSDSNIFGGQDVVGLPRVVMVMEDSDTSASSPSSPSSSSDNWAQRFKTTEFPAEFWHVQKLVKYMKAGNQTATAVALSCLKDHDLTNDVNQRAIADVGGLEVLVNVLETKNICCILGSLAVLKDSAANKENRIKLLDLGIVPLVVGLLSDPAWDVRSAAAEVLANLGKIRKGRKLCRKMNGIPKLIGLLDMPERVLVTPLGEHTGDDTLSLNMMRAACRALWSMSASKRCREVMRKNEMIRLISRALKTTHLDVAIPTTGLLQLCVEETSFRLAVRTENMVQDLVRHLSNEDKNLKTYCSVIISKCACDPQTRDMIIASGGLELLMEVVSDENNWSNKHLMAMASIALSKCGSCSTSVKRLEELGAVPILSRLLSHESDAVLTSVCAILAEYAKYSPNPDKIKSSIPLLIHQLNYTHEPLLENVSMVLMECAKSQTCMELIEEFDGIRLIWSLLKNDSKRVQASAAWALCPCIQNATDSGEMVRSFVGALELTVDLLDCNDNKVLAAVCALLAVIAQDNENLTVISDLNVVEKLSLLVYTKDEHLRANLAMAIARCCDGDKNTKGFCKHGVVVPLIDYLRSNRPDVLRSTALALYQLSFYPLNCVIMHAVRGIPMLMKTFGSKDVVTQEAIALCVANIRKLPLAVETQKLKLALT